MHVAVSTIEKLLDYVINTREDGLQSDTSVRAVTAIINNNKKISAKQNEIKLST